MSGKILVLKLFPEIFLTNQIAGFFTVTSVKKLSNQIDFLFEDNY